MVKGATKEIGVASDYGRNSELRAEEFIPILRGRRGIKKFREMRENDAVVGAILFAIEQMLRPVHWDWEPFDSSPEAKRAADIVTESFENLQVPFSDFMSDVLSFFTYGFSLFEVVYTRKNSDGNILVHKMAPRAQWTIERLAVDDNGEYAGAYQSALQRNTFLPKNKTLLFRTTSVNRDPAGRSALRNAYISYYRLNHIQEVEAVAIERELNGLPIVRIPSEYLSATATDAQKAVKDALAQIARDVKKNEQGYVMLPSDLIADEEGRLSEIPMVDLKLLSSNGTRDIDTNKVIIRYQQDIARSVMADFIMLGTNDRGSFAMSKSKSDLFLKALTGYMSNVGETLRRQLFPNLLMLNGIDPKLAPIGRHGNIAPVDLEELGQYLQRIGLAGAPMFPDTELENELRRSADLPMRQGDAPAPAAPVAPVEDPIEDDDDDDDDTE
jgi:hypothetical protein